MADRRALGPPFLLEIKDLKMTGSQNQETEPQLEGRPFNPQKSEGAAKELLTILIRHELTEAETVDAIIQALTIRIAYASKDLEDLWKKLQKAEELFGEYTRSHLSQCMSAIIARDEFNKGAH
jgi:hypothetical protein